VSYNPGYQSVLKELKRSTRQRFIALDFDYPAPEVEAPFVLDWVRRTAAANVQIGRVFATQAPRIALDPEARASGDPARQELILDGNPVPTPDSVNQLLTSIELDLGAIPPDYLVPAGPGEYDPDLVSPRPRSQDDVWSGTYHEDGATSANGCSRSGSAPIATSRCCSWWT
jgi:hypothetical protein